MESCRSKAHFVATPTPAPCCIPPCDDLLLHTLLASAWYGHASPKKLGAKVLVAGWEILLQAYLAERPSKPVTNPMFLIHSHRGTMGALIRESLRNISRKLSMGEMKERTMPIITGKPFRDRTETPFLHKRTGKP